MRVLRIKPIVLLFSCLFFFGTVRAQDDEQGDAHFRIRYVINIPEVDTAFVDNNVRIGDMRDFLIKLREDPMVRITGVRFRGTASPDGGYEFNRWLSVNRLRTFKELVNKYVYIPDSIIHANTSDIPWDEFRREVETSTLEYRDEILAVIDRGPSLVPWFNNRHIDPRLLTLKRMHGGRVWESLKESILRDLRYGDAVFSYYRMQSAIAAPQPEFNSMTIASKIPPPTAEPLRMPHIYLKTNLIGIGMLMANLACELDISPHWSFTLPIYYSAIDYFKSTVKFRNFTVQPEFRYWPLVKSDGAYYRNDGLFVGAHFELSYYNFAFDGRYRYQDYRGRTPALGGGLSLGYRTAVSRNRRWKMEFSAGAGIYPLDYSLFNNTPDVKDGEWVARRRKTYIGLDQLSVNIAYTFDWVRRAREYHGRKGGCK